MTMESPGDIEIREVAVELILELRTRVLRPHFPDGELARFDGDHEESSLHWAALDVRGDVVGCLSYMVRRGPGSLPKSYESEVQLRGMAIAPEVQRRGVGRRLLESSMGILALRYPGGRVWCDARTSAQGFYQGAGFEAFGEVFEKPVIGPHVVMAVELPLVLA
ncbi:MAG: GNAT family N-acetyltransferase [Myxococcota bacterium]